MASARSDFDPAATASPAARNSATSSRPCRDIHTLCQVSIKTAKPRMLALKISWPLPPKSSDKPLVNTATRHAPKTPAATPPTIHIVRPGTVEVTAMTMPTTRPASKTSRKTISNDASTGPSFHCNTISPHDPFTARRERLASHGGNRRRNCSGPAVAAAHKRRPRCRPERSSRNADRCFRIRTRWY